VAPHERSRRLLSPNKKVASMRIGLDIDGLLDERPDFFSFLSHALRAAGHFVAVLTYRDADSRTRTEGQLAGWAISYDELHFARSLSDKGRLCRELKIDVYFDDQDECLVGVDEGTTVFRIRNGGNFDFAGGKWLSTLKLTRHL
jgi:uncharacterized HAD superfamily protein